MPARRVEEDRAISMDHGLAGAEGEGRAMPCALTTSLIEAQLLGADLCRAHLRGMRLRGADRRQASLGAADLCETDLGTA